MRICQPGLSDKLRSSDSKTRSLNKTKRACDECAKAKAKCNYRIPCDRCHRKSVKCKKTRKGYEDPYAIYSIATPATTPPVITVEVAPAKVPEAECQPIAAEDEEPVADRIIDHGVTLCPNSVMMIHPIDPALELVAETMCISENEATSLSQEPTDKDQNAATLMLSPSSQLTQVQDNSPIFIDHTSMMTEFDLSGSSCSFGPHHADPVSLHLASMGNLDLLLNPQSQYEPIQGLPIPRVYVVTLEWQC